MSTLTEGTLAEIRAHVASWPFVAGRADELLRAALTALERETAVRTMLCDYLHQIADAPATRVNHERAISVIRTFQGTARAALEEVAKR